MASNKITKFKLANNQTYELNDGSAVHFDATQGLTTAQKEQARENIDAAAATKTYTVTITPSNWTASGSAFIYNYSNSAIRATTSPIISCTNDSAEYNYIIGAEATAGTGIKFTASKKPTGNIVLSIVDVG